MRKSRLANNYSGHKGVQGESIPLRHPVCPFYAPLLPPRLLDRGAVGIQVVEEAEAKGQIRPGELSGQWRKRV